MVTRSLVVVLLGAVLGAARPGEEEAIPAPLAPLEPLVGSWKGTAIPTADRIRGWPERHQWSWKFDRGVPVALTVSIEGGRVLTRALLRHDLATRQYRLEGTDTAGRPADYAGMREETTGALVLDRVGAAPDGSKERLTIRPNSNRIRYTMTVDRQ
ncbi:MAG TPA: hypothetical protein VF590_26270, partial [Isosphaeraceae bacterium]